MSLKKRIILPTRMEEYFINAGEVVMALLQKC